MNWFRLTVLLLLVYIATLLTIIGLMVLEHHAYLKETNNMLGSVHTQISHLHYDRFKNHTHDDEPE